MKKAAYYDWQLRVIQERDDLTSRLSKLLTFIRDDIFKVLNDEEQRRMLKQSILMEALIQVLSERIACFVLPPPIEVPTLAAIEGTTMLTNGGAVPDDASHKKLRHDGQQTAYVVLTPAERMKGFINPVRKAYIHKKCGIETVMAPAIAETYARDPWFYTGTFCCACRTHFDLSEFTWTRDGESLDPLLWSDETMKRVLAAKQERE